MVNTEDLQKEVFRLLDKAGRDPRLTPRLLREKAEKTLKLDKGALKPKREKIKTMILQWLHEDQIKIMKLLARVAKVSGSAPTLFKEVKTLATDQERIDFLRER